MVQAHLVSDDGDVENVVELAASTLPGPGLQIDAARFSDAAKIAIHALPPEVRLVATLFFVNDLSYKEIADATDSPIGTAMSRLSRGRKQLRDSLQPYVSAQGLSNLEDNAGFSKLTSLKRVP